MRLRRSTATPGRCRRTSAPSCLRRAIPTDSREPFTSGPASRAPSSTPTISERRRCSALRAAFARASVEARAARQSARQQRRTDAGRRAQVARQRAANPLLRATALVNASLLGLLIWALFGFAIAAAAAVLLLVAAWAGCDVRQHAYEDAPQTHQGKTGTPTMGGLVFVVALARGAWQSCATRCSSTLVFCRALRRDRRHRRHLDDSARRESRIAARARSSWPRRWPPAIFLRAIDAGQTPFPTDVLFHAGTFVDRGAALALARARHSRDHRNDSRGQFDRRSRRSRGRNDDSAAGVARARRRRDASARGGDRARPPASARARPSSSSIGIRRSSSWAIPVRSRSARCSPASRFSRGEMLLLLVVGARLRRRSALGDPASLVFQGDRRQAHLPHEPAAPSLRDGRLAGDEGDGSLLACIAALFAARMGHRAMSDIFRFDAGETILVIGLGRSGLASIEVLREHRRHALRDRREAARGAARARSRRRESFGARFVEPADARQRRRRADLCGALARRSADVAGRAAHARGERSRARRDRARLSSVQGADRRGHRNEGQVDDDGADRPSAARLRSAGSRRRQHRQSAHQGSARSRPPTTGSSPRSRRSSSRRFARSNLASPCLLNVSPDHLDRYHSMDEYAEAKYRICANQSLTDWFVGNLDDPTSPRAPLAPRRHARAGAGSSGLLSRRRRGDDVRARRRADLRAGRRRSAPDPDRAARRDSAAPASTTCDNAMAALLAALAVGCRPEALRAAMRDVRADAAPAGDRRRDRRRALRRRFEVDESRRRSSRRCAPTTGRSS